MMLEHPGIEPGLPESESDVLPLDQCSSMRTAGLEPAPRDWKPPMLPDYTKSADETVLANVSGAAMRTAGLEPTPGGWHPPMLPELHQVREREVPFGCLEAASGNRTRRLPLTTRVPHHLAQTACLWSPRAGARTRTSGIKSPARCHSRSTGKKPAPGLEPGPPALQGPCTATRALQTKPVRGLEPRPPVVRRPCTAARALQAKGRATRRRVRRDGFEPPLRSIARSRRSREPIVSQGTCVRVREHGCAAR